MASIEILDNNTSIKRYKVYYDVDYGDNKRHRKSKTFPAGTPKSVVMDFKQKVEIEYRLGTLGILESKVTMDELIQKYFDTRTESISPTTKINYERMVECKAQSKGIRIYFHNMVVRKITTQMMQEYIVYLIKCGLSPKSVRNYAGLCNLLFTCAEDYGYIREGSNPCRKLKLPKKENKEVVAYDRNELQYLIDLAKEQDNQDALMIISLCGLAGLRRGELCGLRWENVCLEEPFKYIKVCENIVKVRSTVYEKDTKSKAGMRTIPIGDNLADLLSKHKKMYDHRKAIYGEAFADSGYVMSNELGQNILPKSINDRYNKFVKSQTEVPFKSLHSLRRTFASLLAMTGTNPKELQQLMGHSDYHISLNVYTRSYEEATRKDTERLDRLILGDGENVG